MTRRAVRARSSAPLEIPAQRPVATGEIVAIADWPEYKARHGLRIVGGGWKPTEMYPHIVVEIEKAPEVPHA